MVSTQQLTYILALVETGSFSRAAASCFVTQPTLSMQIKKAEDQLGFVIFQRDTSPLELTDFGRELIPILRQIQSELAAVNTLTAQFAGTYQDRLRVGIIPTVACYMLQDSFAEWQTLLPTTKLHIEEYRTEELLEALETRKIDLAILAGPVETTKWRTIPLYSEEIVAYINHSEQEQITVNELHTMHPWLLTKGNCLRTQMMHFCSLADQQSDDWNYAGGNLDMLMRMVDANNGYTLIPENYKRTFPAKSSSFKRIVNEAGQSPGRSIIALSAYRHSNWDAMEKIIRSLQLRYASAVQADMELLSWK
jgi:LysR family hydrogen peroxide-inducible transcriptional activator